MEAFAVAPQKSRDEVAMARQFLDKLHRRAAEVEVLPEKTAAAPAH